MRKWRFTTSHDGFYAPIASLNQKPTTHAFSNLVSRCWLALLATGMLVLLACEAYILVTKPALTSNTVHGSWRMRGKEELHQLHAPVIDVGHLALLDTLWSAIPFTRVLKPPTEAELRSRFETYNPAVLQPSSQRELGQHHQQPIPTTTSQSSSVSQQSGNRKNPTATSSSSSSSRKTWHMPALSSPAHPEIALLHSLAAAVLDSSLPLTDAKQAYVSAFQSVQAPAGFPPWQVELPVPQTAETAAAANAQHQHKGAEFLLEDPDADEYAGGPSTSAADFLKGRPEGRTAADNAAIAAAAAAATAFLATQQTTAEQQQQQQQQQTHVDDSAAQQQHTMNERTVQRQQQLVSYGKEAAEHLMRCALLLIKASHRLSPCGTDDASLPLQVISSAEQPQQKVVLAVTLLDQIEAMPSLVLQLVQFAMQSAPGSLGISVVDGISSSSSSGSTGGSSDVSFYMDILQLLTAPLRVPTIRAPFDRRSEHRPHSIYSETLAAARNAAIESFFPARSNASCGTQEGVGSTSVTTSISHSHMAHSWDAGSGTSSAARNELLQQQQTQQQLLATRAAEDSTMTRRRLQLAQAESAAGSQMEAASRTQQSTTELESEAAGVQFIQQQLELTDRESHASYQEVLIANNPVAAAARHLNPPDDDGESVDDADHTSGDHGDVIRDTESERNGDDDVEVEQASPGCFRPDWVLFVDGSTFFCKSDLQRLMMHTTADLACGMALHVAEPSPPTPPATSSTDASRLANAAAAEAPAARQLQQQQQASILANEGLPNDQQQLLLQPTLPMQLQQQEVQLPRTSSSPLNAPAEATQQATSPVHRAERPPALDIWKHPVIYADASINRMVNGQPFTAAPYFAAAHPPTLRRLVAGLPAQAYCCWSGLAKLTAEPFKRGLRFRAQAMAGECQATDRNLLCDDLHRLGFNKVLIDAGVLLTRSLDVTVKISPLVRAYDRAPFIRRSRWVEVEGSGFHWEDLDEAAWRQTYQAVQCCQDPTEQTQQLITRGASAADRRLHPQQLQQQQEQQQLLLTVDEMVQAAAASQRVGGPLQLRGWDAVGCRPADIMASNHTAAFLQGLVSSQQQ